uniref:Complement C3a receptor 1 n=1 Tax=Crocodylus porosus TaxID=8502 RepID=A0A7M4F2N3_CROPO
MPPYLFQISYEHMENVGLYNSPESIVSLAIFILVFILGLPGNGLVIWVAGRKMKRTVNSVWFLNLAMADFLCCLSLPFHIAHLFLHDDWPYGSFLCKVIPSAIIFNMFASVFLLTAISIDRYLLVMKPVWCQNHRTVRFAWVTCAIIWILAFVMCSPLSDLPGGPSDKFNDGMYSLEYTMEDYSDYVPQSSLSVITLTITRTLFGFLLPFGIMAACYGLIAFKMHASQFKKPRGKTLQVIVVVVAALFVCWAPYHIVGILLLTVKPYTTLWKMLPLWDHLSIALAYVNSCINPVVYAFVGRDFREKARLSLKVILERALSEEVTHTTAYSRSTRLSHSGSQHDRFTGHLEGKEGLLNAK